MATAKKVASKKTVKKAVKKTATKRAYNRKPKTTVEDAQNEQSDVMAATDVGSETFVQETPALVQLSDYGLWDLRNVPVPVRMLFLLELESLGYVLKTDLRAPSEGTSVFTNADLIQIISLNHVNKLISFMNFGELNMAQGVIAEPQYLESRLNIFSVRTSMAAPNEVTIQGERFVRV
ncbi:hypothetical protein RIVERRIDER_35 [Xanthomonas phage RiverRider]|uniref:Uncharacterized protein n=1 Tax=Xanthomonas phage RiverRider TaxID=2108116 RepID=A0A2P1JUY5_9CAUD|nr:hypothetical protein HWB58_gp35 [Xanthomonas phage RiverRider]AVO23123.1 hypothetical protein RIVERRIDER_35 [Xanthomonas phage RiverRider]